MTRSEEFIAELEFESISARKMLKDISAYDFDWKPHERSMSMGQLSTLVAMMFGWFGMMATTDELDFAKGEGGYPKIDDANGLVKLLETGLAHSKQVISNMTDGDYEKTWKLRSGEVIHQEMSVYLTFRQTFSHLAHHRGQLSVYLRLKDIPVPPMYGPTADDNDSA